MPEQELLQIKERNNDLPSTRGVSLRLFPSYAILLKERNGHASRE